MPGRRAEMSARAVFLDRDGVLNRAPLLDGQPMPPASLAEMEILPGVATACRDLARAGFLLVGATNQPDIARGRATRATVDAINAALTEALDLDDIRVCPHDDADGCDCRKPKPGMLLAAARDFDIDLRSSIMVGDRWKDVAAGEAAGCRTVFVDHGYAERRPDNPGLTCAGLDGAVAWIIGGGAERLMAATPDIKTTDLKVKVFADGANVDEMVALLANPLIAGFTTNPTLMRKAGVADYEAFARAALDAITAHPISFEVFADDFDEMARQALRIAAWGDNTYVKIPITNTRGESAVPLIERLAGEGVKVNVTALMTTAQVADVAAVLAGSPPAYVSVFAGRIADTGRDPEPEMREAVDILSAHPQAELIWASPREVYDILRADAVGCPIITVTYDLLKKVDLFGKDLDAFSLETVTMFHDDARAAGYTL